MEIRIALRRLSRSPGFTVAVCALLGLGIGASTAIFSVVDAVLLQPLVPDQERVVVMFPRDDNTDAAFVPLSIPDFRDWQAGADSFDEIAGFGNQSGSFSLLLDGGAHDIRATAVTPSFFDVAGVPPLLGRGFLPDEDQPGSERVVVFSYDVWQSVFGGDPELVGRRLTLDDDRFLVVGIMPRGFDFPNQTGLWAVARFEPPVDNRGWGYLLTLGRVSKGVTLKAAVAQMEALDDRLLMDTSRGDQARRRVETVPVLDFFLGQRTRSTFAVLALAVGIMFLVACVNVASLVLSRSQSRQQEYDVMVALGASRADLLRTFLTEAALLSVGGAAAGFLLAGAGLGAMLRIAPTTVPRLATAAVDLEALGFAVAIAGLVATILTLTPALRAGQRFSVARERPGGKRRQAIVAFEVAATVVLVVGASLLVASAYRLLHADLGYRPENVFLLGVVGPTDPVEDPEAHRALMTRLMEHAGALPDVASAAVVMLPPFQSGTAGWDLWWVAESQGHPMAPRERANPDNPDESLVYFGPAPEAFDASPRVVWEAVSGSYFQTMGLPLLRGRTFDARDDADAPRVVIVSESFARSTWPGMDPLGQRMMTLGFRYDANRRAEWQTVVGVVADARYREIHTARRDVYVPFQQSPLVPSSVVLRMRREGAATLPALSDIARDVHPALRLDRVRSLNSVVETQLMPWRFNATLITSFALATVLIAALGVFATVSQWVSERRREIGIRMAVGATAKNVVSWVLKRGMSGVVAGVLLGITTAALLSRYLQSHLYEVAPLDMTVYTAVSMLVGGVGALASLIPAARAAETNPTEVLRAD